MAHLRSQVRGHTQSGIPVFGVALERNDPVLPQAMRDAVGHEDVLEDVVIDVLEGVEPHGASCIDHRAKLGLHLVPRADAALYEAKVNGRNRLVSVPAGPLVDQPND